MALQSLTSNQKSASQGDLQANKQEAREVGPTARGSNNVAQEGMVVFRTKMILKKLFDIDWKATVDPFDPRIQELVAASALEVVQASEKILAASKLGMTAIKSLSLKDFLQGAAFDLIEILSQKKGDKNVKAAINTAKAKLLSNMGVSAAE